MVLLLPLGLVISFLISFVGRCKTSKLQRSLFERQSRDYPELDSIGPTPKREWVTAYQREKNAGRIPHLAPSIRLSSYDIRYSSGVNPMSPDVCSWTMGCVSPAELSAFFKFFRSIRRGDQSNVLEIPLARDDSINDAPAGMMGISLFVFYRIHLK